MVRTPNGIIPDITQDEIDEIKRHEAAEKRPDPTPTLDERVTNVENELSEIKTSYQEGVNNA